MQFLKPGTIRKKNRPKTQKRLDSFLKELKREPIITVFNIEKSKLRPGGPRAQTMKDLPCNAVPRAIEQAKIEKELPTEANPFGLVF